MAKTTNAPKPRNDAYTGLLAISFLALVGATVLLAMDSSELGTPPAAFKVDAPGAKAGNPGDTFKRTDTSKIDTTPNPEPKAAPKVDPAPAPVDPAAPKVDPAAPAPAPKAAPAPAPAVEPKAMSLNKQDVEIPAVVIPPTIIQVGAVEPATGIETPKVKPAVRIDSDAPPLIVKPFVPPM